jgi:hypothetical protein
MSTFSTLSDARFPDEPKIVVGMTLSEVEAILGPAPSKLMVDNAPPNTNNPAMVQSARWHWFKTQPDGRSARETKTITVYFEDGRVKSKEKRDLD